MRTIKTIQNLEMSRATSRSNLKTVPAHESISFVSILGLLQRYDTASCVDQRDCLYALYGLSISETLPQEQEKESNMCCPVD